MKVNPLYFFKTNLYLQQFFIAEVMGKTTGGMRLWPSATSLNLVEVLIKGYNSPLLG